MDPDRVAAMFQRILEVPAVAPDQSFFDLGGDSLLATRVLSAIARDADIELTYDDFALHPTPAALAGLVTTAAR